MIDALKYLQDDVAPMPFSTIKGIIEKDFDKPLHEIFAQFDEQALAAGSVAQVHKAKLRDGTIAAVKVLRDNLEDSFEQDLRVLAVLSRLGSVVPGVTSLGAVDLLDEFGCALHKQLDFRAEVDNNRALAETYSHLEWVRLADVYDEYCTDNVITMEFVEGKKCDEHMAARNNEPDRLVAERLYELYIDMAFNKQLLHVDMHEGNLLIDDQDRLVLLDHGVGSQNAILLC